MSGFGAGFNPNNASNISFNPYQYPSEVCPNCGCEVFAPGVILKKVPGVVLGVGSEEITVPIKVAICAKCGTLSESDQKMIDEETKKAKKAEELKKSTGGLIL